MLHLVQITPRKAGGMKHWIRQYVPTIRHLFVVEYHVMMYYQIMKYSFIMKYKLQVSIWI